MSIDTLKRPNKDLDNIFVPVIFANGEDDDIPGLVAAIEHKWVQFDGHIYKPHEDIVIHNRHLVMSRSIYVIGLETPLPEDLVQDHYIVVRIGNTGRHITITDNLITMRTDL